MAIETEVRLGDAVDGIQEVIVQKEAALLVMATHGRSGVVRTRIGSVASRLMQHIDVPVVLIRPLPAREELPGSLQPAANALS